MKAPANPFSFSRRESSQGQSSERGRKSADVAPQDAWLIADIGGTNTRIDHWSAERNLTRVTRRTYRNDDFTSIAELMHAYRGDVGSGARQALLAAALPVTRNESLQMTNRDWSLDVAALRAGGLTRLRFVNDLVAAAAGIDTLGSDEVEASGGLADAEAPRLVIGIGTGLGAATVLTDVGRARVLASEAGHMTAAAGGADASRVREWSERRYGRASWERLLSGPGLAQFDAVARADRGVAATETAARARNGEPSALRAVNAFAHALGEFAGDLCLALCAHGGVYFTGGVVTGLAQALNLGTVRAGFEAKGRFAAQLRTVPLYRVKVDDLALRGLGRLLEGALDAQVVEAEAT
jgi:glucokinase